MNKLSKFILDIFFPNRCPFCDCFIKGDKLACDRCIDEISYIDDKVCGHCGKVPCICDIELFYEKCYAACYYEGIVKNGIINLKIKNAINTAEIFADILSVKILSDGIKYDFGCIQFFAGSAAKIYDSRRYFRIYIKKSLFGCKVRRRRN